MWEKIVLVIKKNFCKFEVEGQEFVMFLRFTFLGLSTMENFKIVLEQIIQTVKGEVNYGNRIFFKLFLSFRGEKWGNFFSNWEK